MRDDIPFFEVCSYFASRAIGALQAKTKGSDIRLSASCLHDLSFHLSAGISQYLASSVYELFSTYRGSAATALANFLSAGPEHQQLSDHSLQTFSNTLLEDHCLSFFESVPHARDVIENYSRDWVAHIVLILERVRCDRISTTGAFSRKPDSSVVVQRISCDQADAHFAGRSSAVLRVDGGDIVYKSRPVRNDLLFGTVLAQFGNLLGTFIPPQPVTLDKGVYGWQEYVSRANEMTAAEARRYFRYCGQLLFVAWVCSASDCHSQNTIASSGYPFIIDCETFFSAQLSEFSAPARASGFEKDFVEELQTFGFFPIVQHTSNGTLMQNNAIFCDGHTYKSAVTNTRWRNVGSDLVAPYQTNLFVNMGASSCLISGVHQTPRDFAGEICEGFLSCVKLVLDERLGRILEETIIGASEQAIASRVIVRDTLVYDSILSFSFARNHMMDEAARTLAVDTVLKNALPHESMARVRAYESAHLLNGYIPRFWADNRSGCVTGDNGEVCFESHKFTSGRDIVMQRLRFIRSTRIAYDEIIHASLEGVVAGPS